MPQPTFSDLVVFQLDRGRARPKIETVTRRRARSSSTCSTEPLKLAKPATRIGDLHLVSPDLEGLDGGLGPLHAFLDGADDPRHFLVGNRHGLGAWLPRKPVTFGVFLMR